MERISSSYTLKTIRQRRHISSRVVDGSFVASSMLLVLCHFIIHITNIVLMTRFFGRSVANSDPLLDIRANLI